MENKLSTRFQREELAKRVLYKYQNVFNKDSKKTWLYFKAEGCARATIKRYIKMYGESENINFKKPPGRPPTIATPRKLKSIENFFDKNPSTTTPVAAEKLKIQKNVSLVLKDENPPNVPHLRPIETFWALCKKAYSKLQKTPDTLRKFRFQWKKISEEVAKSSGKSLMENVKKKIKYEMENGVKSSLFTKF
jgi:hypothetical protein